MLEKKIFFHEGDVVELKQNIPNKPIMIVGTVIKSTRSNDSENVMSYTKPVLLGVKCYWFTTSLEIQEKTFNTKDLVKLEDNN